MKISSSTVKTFAILLSAINFTILYYLLSKVALDETEALLLVFVFLFLGISLIVRVFLLQVTDKIYTINIVGKEEDG
jgi:hypothetical protein